MGDLFGKDQPSTPDPYQTAQAQTQSNQQTAQYNAALNRVDQYTPFGNSVYSNVGTDASGAPHYRQDVTLAPDAQAQLTNQLKQNEQLSNLGFGIADQAGSALKSPIDTSGLPALHGGASPGQVQTSISGVPGVQSGFSGGGPIQTGLDFSHAPGLYGVDDFNAANLRTQAAEYAQATSRLNPQWTNAQNQQDAKLANMGVQFGSGAYGKAQTQFDQAKNDAYNQALFSAIGAGNQEQQNLFGNSLAARQQSVGETQAAGNFANQAQQQRFGQNAAQAAFANQAQQQAYDQAISSGQFGNAAEAQAFAQAQSANQADNAARAQGLQEQSALRDIPLNELNALRASTQIQNPQFQPVPQSQAGQTDVAGNVYKSAQMNQDNYNNFMNGLFSIGSAAIMASDRRLKSDIRRIGKTDVLGLPVFEYSYIWDRARRHIGVMAQDVLRIKPEAVLRTHSGYLLVDYGQVA
jgi:hypothetical protein